MLPQGSRSVSRSAAFSLESSAPGTTRAPRFPARHPRRLRGRLAAGRAQARALAGAWRRPLPRRRLDGGRGLRAAGRTPGRRRTERLRQTPRHLIQIPFGVDHPQQAARAVEIDQRPGLLVVHPQPLGHRRFVVVRALHEPMRGAGPRTQLAVRGRGRASEQIEHAPAVRAGAPAGDASHQLAIVDVELHHRIERLPQRCEQPLERVSLGEVARKTIENETAARIGFAQALADHAQHQGVIDQPATVHGFLGLAAELGPPGYGGPQQISARDLRDAGSLHQTLGLGALAGAGRAQQNDAHVCSVARALPWQPHGCATLPAAPGEVKRRDRQGRRAAPPSALRFAPRVRYSCPPPLPAAPTAMKKIVRRNALYAQSGGVSAVINASACGVIETAMRSRDIGKLYAGRHGIIGALTEDLIDVSRESAATIRALKHTPAGAFGSARFKLKGIEQNRAEYERLIEVFRAHDIGYFFYNGGNDSMDTALKVSQIGAALGYPITCVGIPKTVDNDLPATDCCPGFGSVAKYVAVSTREAALDVASMARTSTRVFVFEVMGRHAGWIAAAGGLAGRGAGEPPHIILFPEVPFEQQKF